MYIQKYLGSYIFGADEFLYLVEFLEDQKQEEIPLSEIFVKTGLDRQNWDFQKSVDDLVLTLSDDVYIDLIYAIDVIKDLSAILLECKVNGSINLRDLDGSDAPPCHICISATPDEHKALNKALSDFVHAPQEYDIFEMMGEDEITQMAYEMEMVRQELYEKSSVMS